MSIKTLNFSGNIDTIGSNVKENIENFIPSFGLYFASTTINQVELNKKLNEILNCNLIGCSSHEEIINTKSIKDSVSIMLFDEESISDSICVSIEDSYSDKCIEESVAKLGEHFGKPILDLDNNHYLGFIYTNNGACKQEFLMDKLGNLTNLIFVGGIAADNLECKETFTYCNDSVHSNGPTVIGIIKLPKGFELIQTQHFDADKSRVLKVTEVSEDGREVITFNNNPALDEYCKVLKIDKNTISKDDIVKDFFFTHPIGLIIDDDIFVKAGLGITDKDSMTFNAGCAEGNELYVLSPDDIVERTRNDLNETISICGKPEAMLEICCAYRTLEIEAKHVEEDYGNIFKDVNRIGYSAMGEEYICHINQTSLMILFK